MIVRRNGIGTACRNQIQIQSSRHTPNLTAYNSKPVELYACVFEYWVHAVCGQCGQPKSKQTKRISVTWWEQPRIVNRHIQLLARNEREVINGAHTFPHTNTIKTTPLTNTRKLLSLSSPMPYTVRDVVVYECLVVVPIIQWQWYVIEHIQTDMHLCLSDDRVLSGVVVVGGGGDYGAVYHFIYFGRASMRVNLWEHIYTKINRANKEAEHGSLCIWTNAQCLRKWQRSEAVALVLHCNVAVFGLFECCFIVGGGFFWCSLLQWQFYLIFCLWCAVYEVVLMGKSCFHLQRQLRSKNIWNESIILSRHNKQTGIQAYRWIPTQVKKYDLIMEKTAK